MSLLILKKMAFGFKGFITKLTRFSAAGMYSTENFLPLYFILVSDPMFESNP
jgi:hypothetical protein